MIFKRSRANPGASGSALASEEVRIGSALPDDYRAFTKESDGCVPDPTNNCIKFQSFFRETATEALLVKEFVSIQRRIDIERNMEGMLPAGFITIAVLSDGNPLLLCLKKQRLGYVYLWEPDFIDDGLDPQTIIASSFSELIAHLQDAFADLDDLPPCNIRYHKYLG